LILCLFAVLQEHVQALVSVAQLTSPSMLQLLEIYLRAHTRWLSVLCASPDLSARVLRDIPSLPQLSAAAPSVVSRTTACVCALLWTVQSAIERAAAAFTSVRVSGAAVERLRSLGVGVDEHSARTALDAWLADCLDKVLVAAAGSVRLAFAFVRFTKQHVCVCIELLGQVSSAAELVAVEDAVAVFVEAREDSAWDQVHCHSVVVEKA
jgi:hypothetical protein